MSISPNENSLLLWKIFVPKNKKDKGCGTRKESESGECTQHPKILNQCKKIKIKTR